ncbi:MAG: rRNA methyltransferase, partial [Actinomycetales bacterium]
MDDPTAPKVGVGPHPEPWPTAEKYDPELLRDGDRRNVGDEYRYWTMAAIRADLATRKAGLHIAIQNWEHDFNIGSMVRTANAFNVDGVHILGRKRWNRRGAMVTDRYLEVHHHEQVSEFFDWLAARKITPIGVDNLPGSIRLETAELPKDCCLIFGSEGP